MTRHVVQVFLFGIFMLCAACHEAGPGAHVSSSSTPELLSAPVLPSSSAPVSSRAQTGIAAACDADCCAACGLCQSGGRPGPCGVCNACHRARCPICAAAPEGGPPPAATATRSGEPGIKFCATDVDHSTAVE